MAVTIPYVKQTHTDGVVNQFNAARANQIEQGISDAHYQPAVHVFHSAAQSITNNSLTALAFNSERYDQAGGASSTQHDTVTNNSRLTALYAGIYAIRAGVEWQGSATSYRELYLRVNGTTLIAAVTDVPGSAILLRQQVGVDYSLAVNDYVELLVFQLSGGALNVNVTSNTSPEFMMARVG